MPVTRYRGKYYVDVYVEVPSQGVRRIRRRSPVQTKRGAEAYERQLVEAALSTSTRSQQERGFAEFAVEYLEKFCAANDKYATLEAKESILRVHLIPEFGTRRLRDVNARDIEGYKAQKLAVGLSPKTVNNHLTVLRKLFSVALEWELVEQIPPVKWVRVPPKSSTSCRSRSRAARGGGGRAVEGGNPRRAPVRPPARRNHGAPVGRYGPGCWAAPREPCSQSGSHRLAEERTSARGTARARHGPGAQGASAPEGRARLSGAERATASSERDEASALACLPAGRAPAGRLARPPAYVRFASGDAGRADPGRAGAARALDDRDDDALRAPEPGM